jgi:CRP-like cAMP-binding protein
VLSEGQLALLAEHGEERRADVGDVLFRVGDRRYPLIAIIEGEAAVLDQTGAEINRHRAGGFLGESNLLSVKRCATAVGDGAMVVRFVHERFSGDGVEATPAAGS